MPNESTLEEKKELLRKALGPDKAQLFAHIIDRCTDIVAEEDGSIRIEGTPPMTLAAGEPTVEGLRKLVDEHRTDHD